MQISLTPVYSKLASELPPALRALVPAGWRLSQHQVETYRALADPNGADVVINTAMTGDGKSLGGQLLALERGWQNAYFGMYPTNELIADQARQAQLTLLQWGQQAGKQAGQPHKPLLKIAELTGRVLDKVMTSDDFRKRGDALYSHLVNNDMIFTNPDIFHYIMHIFYVRGGKNGDAPDQIFSRLIELFEQFTFDEFHVFDIPQVASVMSALVLLRAVAGAKRKRFLFQSATPSPMLRAFLQRGDFSFVEIDGHYLTEATEADPQQWRQILRGSELHFAAGKVMEWLAANLESVLIPFFVEHKKAAKGAVIVNSVAEAKLIVQLLQNAFAPYPDIVIGENTGLTSRSQRQASYAATILVGTSTVDVGVDFHINFLLFESVDAGTFVQRLGRLGRHGGYKSSEGVEHSFGDTFVAYATVPRWVLESLFEGESNRSAPFVEGMTLPRTELAPVMVDAFPPTTSFERYVQAWGGLQSVKILLALKNPTIKNQYSNLSDELMARYGVILGGKTKSIKRQFMRYKELNTGAKTLLDEALSFRGGTYFDCGVVDMTEARPEDQVTHYDLFWLVANGLLTPLSKEEYWTQAARAGIPHKANQEPLAYYRLTGFRPERANFTIRLEDDLAEWEGKEFGVARVLSHITIEPHFLGDVPELAALNGRLGKVQVPAFLCQSYDPMQLKRRLRLPLLFPLYAFRSRDGVAGTIAFGRAALLLDSATLRGALDCGGGAIFL